MVVPVITRTATRTCRTRKRAFHFYSPGVGTWSTQPRCGAVAHAATPKRIQWTCMNMYSLWPCFYAAAAAATTATSADAAPAAAAAAAVYAS